MPVFVKFLIYFAVLAALVWATNSLPKSTEPLKGFVAVVSLGWMVCGVFIVLRTAFRFITR